MASNPAKTPDNVLSILLPKDAVTHDVEAFDDLVHNQGVRMVHYRAIPCPIGLDDEHEARRTHADHVGCSNGYLYKAIGRVTVVFTANSLDPKKMDQGFMDGSMASVTFPRFYDSDPEKRVLVRPMDRLFLEEEAGQGDSVITTATWDKLHRRNDGTPDRARFPIIRVHHLIDSTGVWYEQGIHFDVVAGSIVWRENQGPALARVYSVWYEYRPFWYVDRLVHEIRVTPATDYLDTSKVKMERHAFGAILVREYVYRNQQVDDATTGDASRNQDKPDSITDPFGDR